jgi:(2Fe-2S) ferredoxin
MTHYQKHVFFCTNQRDNGKQCCADNHARELMLYAKTKLQTLDLHGKGKVRINQAGCMDRCSEGPVLVIYPDAVWYRYETKTDVDEIINEHVLHDRVVKRLLLDNKNKNANQN